MKKFLCILPMLMIVFAACEKEFVESVDEEILVGFTTGGEISVMSSPLSKGGSSTDLYGVQIEKVYEDGSKTHYCYGLFDDMSLAKVKMYPTDKYEVKVGYVPNGKNVVKLIEGTEEYGSWEIPFNNSGWKKIALNEFTYDKSSEIFHLEYAVVVGNGGSRTDGPHRSGVSYYFAKVDEYTPTAGNPVLSLNLLRYNFGLEFIFKSSDYAGYDKILIQLDTDYSTHESFYATVDQTKEYSKLTISPILSGSYNPDNSIKFTIGTDADATAFYDGQLSISRNEMYHITVTRPETATSSSMRLTVDNAAMTDINKTI